jgi:hypothetical protein
MHTGNDGMFKNLNSVSLFNINRYLEKLKVPHAYGRDASHMIFESPENGTSIADYFNIEPITGRIPNIRYTLGY